MKIHIENVGDLEPIISHYKAMDILISSAMRNKDYKALIKWDKARNSRCEEIVIKIVARHYI